MNGLGCVIMRILVIGAGYIGSIAAQQLIKKENYVFVLDASYIGYREASNDDFVFYQGELKNTILVTKILQDEKSEAVMHAATYFIGP